MGIRALPAFGGRRCAGSSWVALCCVWVTTTCRVGINWLRRGSPEVAGDPRRRQEGFRGQPRLIQTIGRAARNVSGEGAQGRRQITDLMREAIDETDRRLQIVGNEAGRNHHSRCRKDRRSSIRSIGRPTPSSRSADPGATHPWPAGLVGEPGWAVWRRRGNGVAATPPPCR